MTPAPYAIRLAGPADLPGILELAAALWPDEPAEDLPPHMAATLAGKPLSSLPLVVFVAESDGALIAFIEVGLRSHADGCDGRKPVGYIEGWYVRPEHRRQGIGEALVTTAEQWSREQGAVELASDTWVDHQLSIDVHRALGFEVVDRTINFRKSLT
jgi:aminoglycoside 6'-N-acetyltransferase I